MTGGAEPPKQSAQALGGASQGIASHRQVRGDPLEGPHTEVTMHDGTKHTMQRMDAGSSMGLPGWHLTSGSGQNTWLADTREEALRELERRHRRS